MAPNVCWLQPDDYLCSKSRAKAKQIASLSVTMKSKQKITSKGAKNFSSLSLPQKRQTFDELKQRRNEPVARYYYRIKEFALHCEFQDDIGEKLKRKFVEGLLAGPIHDQSRHFKGSMADLLDFAKKLETKYSKSYNKFSNDSDNDDVSEDSYADVDFEQNESNYRKVHTYDCPCRYCEIIRCDKTKTCCSRNNLEEKKIILIPRWL